MDKELLLVGDKVLVQPDEGDGVTDYGLYLPQTVKEKDKIQSGKVVKAGPGYPIFDPTLLDNEPWAVSKTKTKYFPLQVQEQDFCIFLRESSVEIELEKKKYFVVPYSAILLIMRNRSKPNLEEII